MIINAQYFQTKELYIPNSVAQPSIGSVSPSATTQLNEEIESIEQSLLLDILGYEQLQELNAQFETNGDWKAGALQKWIDLVDGKEDWKGLRYSIGTKKISLIAYYVFFYYLEMDFQKMYQNQAFVQLQKFSRGTFFIIKHDLVQGTGDNFTTIGRFKAGSSGTLIMEKKFTCKISVPESTGVKVENVGNAVNNIELNNRKPVFFYKQYGPNSVPAPAGVTRIDEEQPSTAI